MNNSAMLQEKTSTKMFSLIPGNNQQVTCIGYKDSANEPSRCAKIFYEKILYEKDKLFAKYQVLYNLVGFALELYFKAYILWAEDSLGGYKAKLQELSTDNKIRHNLVKLYSEARYNGLDYLLKGEEQLIRRLSPQYKVHCFRYRKEKYAQISEIDSHLFEDYLKITEKIQTDINNKIYIR